ncbi:MAG: hypothetical protein IKZ49_04715 [Alphaproteobacteria bacterium]|nr:hypothetical protein [Alphaproteobacteria bacterium]
MTIEELENFVKSIIKDIEENEVSYVGDDITKMCTIGNASKVIINYIVDRDGKKEVFSILGIKRGVFQRMFAASPLKNYLMEIDKLCNEKGVNENTPLITKKNPRIR